MVNNHIFLILENSVGLRSMKQFLAAMITRILEWLDIYILNSIFLKVKCNKGRIQWMEPWVVCRFHPLEI